MDNRYYIIRGDRSGVFFGHISHREGREVTITERRRLWYWAGAASLSQMAAEGVKRPLECEFAMAVDELVILDAIELIPCTDAAAGNIKAVSVWRV